MTVLTSTMRMQLDAGAFVAGAKQVSDAVERDVKRIGELKAALKETGGSDRLQASLLKVGATATQIEGVRRALENFRAEQGLVGVAAAQMSADQRKALRTFESATVATVRMVVSEEKKLTAEARVQAEARAAGARREEASRVEAVQQAAAATIATERRLAAQIAEQDQRAENRRIALLAVTAAERVKGDKRAAAAREAIEAEVTAKVRTEAHARIAATQEEAVAIERIARHERELRVRAIEQETAAIVAARHRQAEADAHAQGRAGVGHMATQAAAAYVSAHGVVSVGERVLEAGSERQSERINMTNAGITPAEVIRIENDALKLSAAVGNVSQTQVMEVAKELRSMIADPKELDKVLDPIIKAKSVLDSMDKTGASSSGIAQLLKAGELVGAAKDPERLTRLIDGWVKVMQVSGKTVTPDQIFEFVKYAKTSGATLSDRFLTTVGPSILQELGGSTTGNDIAMMSKTIATGFSKTHAGMREAARAGLINPDDIDYLKTGEAKGLKPGREHAVKGDTLFQTDPDKWVYEVLIPHLEAAGIKKQDDQLAWVQRVFTGTSADFIAKTITQRQAYDVHGENYGAALGLKAVGENAQSAAVGLNALSKSFENLSANVSAPAMGAIGTALNGVASLVNKAADLAAEHPVAAVTAGGIVGGAGLAASGTLAYYVATGFGLPKAALALEAAAAKIGASGAVGAVEGAGPSAAAAITAGGLAASVAAVAAPIALAIIAGKKDQADREAFERTKDSPEAKALPDLGEQSFMQRLWGTLPTHADGGVVRGAGGPRDDRVPVRLSPGEFVINAGATARHRALLQAINKGDINLPGFADGGMVSSARAGTIGRVALATDSSSAAMLREVMSGAMYEALRRAQDEAGVLGIGGDTGGAGYGGVSDHHAAASIRYGRQHSGGGGGADVGGHASKMDGDVAGRAKAAMAQLEGLGWSHEAAAAAIGNAQQESGVRSDGPLGDTKRFGTGDDAAHGMFQWRGQRFRDLKTFAQAQGKSWQDFHTQVAFFDQESRKYGSAEWRQTHDILHANRGMKRFEGYGDDSFGTRLANARQLAAGKNDGAYYPAAAAPAADAGAIAPAGASAKAVDILDGLNGSGSARVGQALGSIMHAGQWCADAVNGALKTAGVKGSGSSMANSFKDWGGHVDFGAVKRGDVIVEDHGRGRGHVGFATGALQRDQAGNVVAIGMTSGNHGNRVVRDYMERVGQISDLRRSDEEARRDAERAVLPKKPAGSPSAAADPATVNVAPGFKVAGLDELREAHGHVDAIHRKVAGLGSVNLRVRHEGFGNQGDHAPGRVRTALNGSFSSDGRAFS